MQSGFFIKVGLCVIKYFIMCGKQAWFIIYIFGGTIIIAGYFLFFLMSIFYHLTDKKDLV